MEKYFKATSMVYLRFHTKILSVFVIDGDCDLVDPDSGLKNQAHVYYDREKHLKYSAVLVLVDIEFNKNSYYRLQLLETNDVRYKL